MLSHVSLLVFGVQAVFLYNYPMCFNAALVQSAEIIEELYGAEYPAELFDVPAYFLSAFEHPRWPIQKQGNAKIFSPALWGLIPSWAKSADTAGSIRNKTINARFESIDSKPSFRGLVNRRRCGVLVDGFVEWRLFDGKKYPYHIALPEKRPFMLAGLWDSWKDPGTDTAVETFSVVTVDAKGLTAQIHNTKLRMPLILGKASGNLWLDSNVSFVECADLMLPLYRTLEAWPVGKEVSMPGGGRNRPDIQLPCDYPGLPSLEAVE